MFRVDFGVELDDILSDDLYLEPIAGLVRSLWIPLGL